MNTQASRVTDYNRQGRVWWAFFNKGNLYWLDTYWNKNVHSCILRLKSTTRVPGLQRTTLIFLTFDQLTWRNSCKLLLLRPSATPESGLLHLHGCWSSEFKNTLLCKNKFRKFKQSKYTPDFSWRLLQDSPSMISAQQHFIVKCWLGKPDSQSIYNLILVSAEKELQH